MFEIDLVVNVLKNGEWHELDNIFEKYKLPEVKVKKILKFLAEYGFIEISSQKMKVSTSLQSFLEETEL